MSRALVSVAVIAAAVVAFAPSVANADEHSIIKSPGDHPAYIFEAEPHLLVGFAGPFDSGGNFGVGFRGAVHIANGFVSSINDSVSHGITLSSGSSIIVVYPRPSATVSSTPACSNAARRRSSGGLSRPSSMTRR